VKIGSRGVTGAALLCEIYAATDAILWGPMEGGSVRHWELRAAVLLKKGCSIVQKIVIEILIELVTEIVIEIGRRGSTVQKIVIEN